MQVTPLGGDMRNPPQGSRQRDREGRKPIQSVLKNRRLSLDIGTQSCWDSPTPPPQETAQDTPQSCPTPGKAAGVLSLQFLWIIV